MKGEGEKERRREGIEGRNKMEKQGGNDMGEREEDKEREQREVQTNQDKQETSKEHQNTKTLKPINKT